MFQFTVYNFLRNLVLTEFEVIYETHVPSVKKRGFVTCSTDRENEISKKIMITQAFNSNKRLNLASRTVKYDSFIWPVMAHVLPECYNNVT